MYDPSVRRFVVSVCAIGVVVSCHDLAGLGDYHPAADGGGGAATTSSTGGAEPQPWLPDYPRRRRLTLATQPTTADLEDFPSPIIVVDDTELAEHAQPDGRDIVFTDADGMTPLHHEIETYDGGSGTLVAWVRLPLVRAASETTIYLYYGRADATALEPGTLTWSNAIYAGVWHLGESPSSAPPQMKDSTDSAVDGVAEDDPLSVPGVAGDALAFDGTTAKVTIADAPQLDVQPAGFAFSFWVKAPASATPGARPVQKIGGATSRGYVARLGSGPWNAELLDAGTPLSVTFGQEDDFIEEWTHLAMSVDPDTGFLTAYTNGAVSEFARLGNLDLAALGNAEPLYVSAPGGPFTGAVDELRIHVVARSDDWFRLEHHALTAPGYLTSGNVELAP